MNSHEINFVYTGFNKEILNSNKGLLNVFIELNRILLVLKFLFTFLKL